MLVFVAGISPNTNLIWLVSRASWVAVGIGLFKSLVLSTFARLTVSLLIPPAVPVNVGRLIGALVAIELIIVHEKLELLSNACASSFNVSNAAGASLIRSLISPSTYVLSAFESKAS